MSRYIDADKIPFFGYEKWKAITTKSQIDRQPTADVRENVKGEWIVDDPQSEHCSNCGHEYYITSLFMVGINDEPPFCPNCGADMRHEKC